MSLPEFQRNASGEPELRSSMVLYADMLGTSQHVQGANASGTIAAMDSALRYSREQSDIDNDYGGSHIAWFSDNVAIAVPLTPLEAEASIGFTLVSTMWLQFELARRGFFLRGGVAIGEHYADDDFQFGPALVDAVGVEQTTVQPRVSLNASAIAVVDLCANFHTGLAGNPFHYELAVEGGTTFISYLDGVVGEADDPSEVLKVLELHRDAVNSELQSGYPPQVAAKYEWLAEYHNFVVDEWVPQQAQLKIAAPGNYQFTRYAPPPGLPTDGPSIHAALAGLLP